MLLASCCGVLAYTGLNELNMFTVFVAVCSGSNRLCFSSGMFRAGNRPDFIGLALLVT